MTATTAWRVFGTAVTVLSLLLAGLATWARVGPRHETSQEEVYRHSVRLIQVSTDGGDITVVAGATGTVSVRRRLAWTAGRAPRVAATWNGDILTVDGHCPRAGLGRACTAGFVLSVPAATAVELRTAHGDLRVTGLTGAVTLTSSAGDVTAEGVAGSLRMRAEAGVATGTALRSAAADVTVGAGAVHLGWVSENPGNPIVVTVVAGTGDVDVALPAGAYRVATDVGAGRQSIDLVRDPVAPGSVTARTGNGDLRLRYAT